WVELGGNGRRVAEDPNYRTRPDGQSPSGNGDAHGPLEIMAAQAETELIVQVTLTDHHDLAGLIGRDQKRGAQVPEDRRPVQRVFVLNAPRLARGCFGFVDEDTAFVFHRCAIRSLRIRS